jgi:endonuclease-8
MPEGDTIFRMAARLRRQLVGRTVASARPEYLARLKGRKLESIEPVGKHLVMRFSGGLSLRSHMRMTGRWQVDRSAERPRAPQHRIRAVVSFGDVAAVAVGVPDIELSTDADVRVRHLGPDILALAFDLPKVIRRARAVEAATVGELLLDQRVSAGIGNIYKCEALWAERVDPWAPPASLPDALLVRLYSTARDLMRRSLAGGNAFRHRAAVHGRAGRPCPRCGTRIEVRAQGKQARLTFYCPACQAR